MAGPPMNSARTEAPVNPLDLNGSLGCMTVGTVVLTSRGEIYAEDLRIGDKILTKDAGYQRLTQFSMITGPRGAEPLIRISRSCLGTAYPSKTTYFLARQLVALRHPMFDPLFGAQEVLACAGDLTYLAGIDATCDVSEVTFIDLGLEHPQLIFADGLNVEINPDRQTSCRAVLSSGEAQLACGLLGPRSPAGVAQGVALH